MPPRWSSAQPRRYTPQQVRDTLVNNATPNVVTNPGTGSPNRLLYLGSGGNTPSTRRPDPGCTQTNGTDVTIRDDGPRWSAHHRRRLHRQRRSGSTVAVNIVHTFLGDLVVTIAIPIIDRKYFLVFS